jgi:hypothetical protein
VTEYVLSIEGARTLLAAETLGAPSVRLGGVGWQTIARELKHNPPSPLELENAIAAIEDEIARAQALPPEGSRVRTADALIREIALAAGLPHEAEAIFTLAAVEQAFQRLAAQATRGLGTADGVAAGKEPAAALVILRELMHHMMLPAITVHSPSDSPSG